jgi:YfiH family protein
MFKKKNNHYFFQTLQKYQNVVHGISTTSFGNMDYRFGNRVEVDKNRQHFFSLLNILQENVIEMDQVHGTNVVIVEKKDRGEVIPKTDSLITNQKNIFLMIKTADCIPIIFFEPKKLVLAVCHAGFLGTVEKIFFHTIFAMINNFNCRTKDILTIIGPSICPQCFTVKNNFLTLLPEWKKFLKPRGTRTSVDFKNFTLENLKKIGIPTKNIHTTDICTFENEEFYSHRRSQFKSLPEDRFATVVGLK